MKTREIIKMIEVDGWMLTNKKGSHMQFKHPKKPGKVTVAFHGMNKDVPPFILNSILRQAGLK